MTVGIETTKELITTNESESNRIVFEAITDDDDVVGRIKTIIEGLEKVLNEVTFVIDADKMYLRTLDSGKAALIEVLLPSSVFREYTFNSEKDLVVSLGTKDLVSLTKNKFKGIEFKVLESDVSDFTLQKYGQDDTEILVANKFRTTVVRSFRSTISLIGLVAPENPLAKSPKLKFGATVRVDAKALKEVFKEVAKVDSYVIMSVENHKKLGKILVFDGEGDVGEVHIEIEHEDCDVMSDISFETPQKCRYALNYFTAFTHLWETKKNPDMVLIEFSTNKPVKFSVEYDGIMLEAILAPNVERR